MSEDMPRAPYLTTRQVAQTLGIHVTQLRYMVDRGEAVPTWRLGRRGELLWEVSEVKRLMAQSDRRTFRKRRKHPKKPLDGLQPYIPRVRVSNKHLRPPPNG